jgi:hypothetical protein
MVTARLTTGHLDQVDAGATQQMKTRTNLGHSDVMPDRVAKFGDQVLHRLLGCDIVAGDEQHPSRLALSRPFFEVRRGDRVERLHHPRTGCMLGDDGAGASSREIGQLQRIEGDERVSGGRRGSGPASRVVGGARQALPTTAPQARLVLLRLRRRRPRRPPPRRCPAPPAPGRAGRGRWTVGVRPV